MEGTQRTSQTFFCLTWLCNVCTENCLEHLITIHQTNVFVKVIRFIYPEINSGILLYILMFANLCKINFNFKIEIIKFDKEKQDGNCAFPF